MTFRNAIMCAGLIAGFGVTQAFASDVLPSENSVFEKWGEESGWTIYVDTSRNTCLAERIDASGNVVQMGLTANKEFGYLGVFTQADLDLKGGDEKIILSLDGDLYEAKAHKKTKHLPEGYTGGYILASNPQFVEDVMKKYEMAVLPEKENGFVVSLDGTYKAIEAARTCNDEQAS